MGSIPSPHFAMFPFLAQGHIIPILHLSRLLHRHSASVTIFTTAANSPPIRAALLDTDVSIVELHFPQNLQGFPQGVENTQNLPSLMSCFVRFARSIKLLQESFENTLKTLNPPVSCIISDGFLGFTLESANKFGVPRFVFFGMGAFSSTMYQYLAREKPHAETNSADEAFPMAEFPGLELTRNHFSPPFNEVEPSGEFAEFMAEEKIAMEMSHGMIVNTFYEMERRYVDYWDKKIGPKIYCVGPLCTVAAPPRAAEKPFYVRFLDEKLAEGESVLYVAFGTQAEVSPEQFLAIAEGLERSEVSFLWIVKSELNYINPNFEEKVKKRGILVKEWVDQLEILKHESVRGSLNHCGWNTVLESITAAVPILALPFMADQHLNAEFVVEELGVGLRMMRSGGSVRGFVEAEEVDRMVRELMCGENGAEAP